MPQVVMKRETRNHIGVALAQPVRFSVWANETAPTVPMWWVHTYMCLEWFITGRARIDSAKILKKPAMYLRALRLLRRTRWFTVHLYLSYSNLHIFSTIPRSTTTSYKSSSVEHIPCARIAEPVADDPYLRIVASCRKHMVGRVDRRGQWKRSICDARGPRQKVRSIKKPVFFSTISTDLLYLRIVQMSKRSCRSGDFYVYRDVLCYPLRMCAGAFPALSNALVKPITYTLINRLSIKV